MRRARRTSRNASTSRSISALNFTRKELRRYQPLPSARKSGLAGATVSKGTLGFRAHRRMHTATILRLSEDLTVIIEIGDAAERVEAFVRDHLDQMVQEGLVTLERAEVIMYRGPEQPRA